MTKFTSFTIGAILAALVAALQAPRKDRDQLSNLAADNTRLSDLIARISRTEASPSEPPRELLRLRGEVARLRQDNQEAHKVSQEKNEEIKKLRKQDPG